jgi:glycosyltransferase involved in cell wall biosynthesis
MARVFNMTPATAGDVTVVIPTYNRAPLLDQTLRSIEQQSMQAADIVVVDDGSTDDTVDMLAERNVTIVRNDGRSWGPARARNEGLERVTTDFVSFVDSDDLLMPRALEQLRAALTAEAAAPFSYGYALAVMDSGGKWEPQGLIAPSRRERRDPLPSLFVRNTVPSSGALVRTDIVRSIGGYDPAVVWSEDHHLWIRLAQQGNPVVVEDVVCAYRIHSGNRYAPADVGVDTGAIFALAHADSALRPRVPDRIGVILCEALGDSIARRHPRAFLHSVRELAPRARRPVRVLQSAAWHFRGRRTAARKAESVWRERTDLRDWLANI